VSISVCAGEGEKPLSGGGEGVQMRTPKNGEEDGRADALKCEDTAERGEKGTICDTLMRGRGF